MERPRLVSELVVSDLDRSLDFWCGQIGFRVLYDRPEDRFTYLDLGGAEVMLEQRDPQGRQWLLAPFSPPLGVGLNLQVTVGDLAPITARLRAADWPLILQPEEKWYRIGAMEAGQRQFVVADPDGYLLRIAQDLGRRTAVVEPH